MRNTETASDPAILYEISLSLDQSKSTEDLLLDLLTQYHEHFDISFGCMIEQNSQPTILDFSGIGVENWIMEEFQRIAGLNAYQDTSTYTDREPPLAVTTHGVKCYVFQIEASEEFLIIGEGDVEIDNGLLNELDTFHQKLNTVSTDNNGGDSVDTDITSQNGNTTDTDIDTRLPDQNDDQISSEKRAIQSLNIKSNDILSSHGDVEVCNHAVECVSEFIESDFVGFYLYNRKKNILERKSTVNNEFLPEKSFNESYLWDVYDSDIKYKAYNISDISQLNNQHDIEYLLSFSVGKNGVLCVGCGEKDVDNQLVNDFCVLISSIANSTLNRIRRVHSLETINTLIEDSLDFDDRETVVREGVNSVVEALGLPVSAVWKHNTPYDELIPVAQTDIGDNIVGDPPVFTPDNSAAWNVFQNNNSRNIDNIEESEDTYDSESPLKSEYISSISDYGVLASGSPRPDNISEIDERVAETLVSTLETSIQHVNNRKQIDILENVIFRVLRHNIRNKMTILKGLTQRVQENTDSDHADKLFNEMNEFADIIENARDMRSVVKNRNKKSQMHVDNILNTCIKSAIEKTNHDNISYSGIGSEVSIITHPNISTAFSHIIENAVEYGTECEADAVKVVADENTDRGVCSISIFDQGNGIPSNEIKAVDEKTETKLEHGSGLGLWIVDRVVNYSDGDIKFNHENGATVKLTFKMVG